MPIIKQEFISPEGELAVWLVEESLDELMEDFMLYDEEALAFAKMSDKRKKEWLVSRLLIHKLSGRKTRMLCIKDAYGKPHLPDTHYQISLSHSRNRVAVLASPYNVGIDIQEIVEKMHRISKKFVTTKERAYVKDDLQMLHVIWGAKEAMYKAWGKKGIDFREQMDVDSFSWNGQGTWITGCLRKDKVTMNFELKAEKIANYICVYAREKYREIG